MFRTIKFSLFAVAAAVISYAPALAEPVNGQNVSIVSTAGLDLSSAAGRNELDHRLVTAANEVCGTPSDADLVGQNRARDCRDDVLREARAASAQMASRGSAIRIAAAR